MIQTAFLVDDINLDEIIFLFLNPYCVCKSAYRGNKNHYFSPIAIDFDNLYAEASSISSSDVIYHKLCEQQCWLLHFVTKCTNG